MRFILDKPHISQRISAFFNVSHSSLNAGMEGKSRLAPASHKTWTGNGPVFTAIVKIPAATPACTPNGAFSITMASLGLSPPFSYAMR